ncbi:PucR-like helix-turn-helix protein [Labedella gwakjiensis]|uniref:PucR-like helix-turn-helix protein n=1 Tax=Labedella gwakjiensis TaxID=390269 RepID=A0A2P8GUY7_9MICO|nr:helix-turn-helix domain-containing protein [Labedella gwakjiensis]PSL37763.1 PucR-like helix-turn-helix protein [Labedella gwakjiensis]RUQ87652.1 hypothetical protein ELQ93_12345 [Labedella gwakjiensis]
MQELVGRLTALDAEATETLKVISYFDALVDGHAGIDVLLRGAAILSGCTVGFTADGHTVRVDASGSRLPAAAAVPGPVSGSRSHGFGDGGRAWIEREGPAHANDEMILERLALALDIAVERASPAAASRRALATLIDRDVPSDDRVQAAARLRLDTSARARYRVVVTPAAAAPTGVSAVVTTVAGRVRVVVRDADDTLEAGDEAEADITRGAARIGIGTAAAATGLDDSWISALLALRLSSPREPVVHADRLGALLLLAELSDARAGEVPDAEAVASLIRSQPRAERLLEVLAVTDSLRAVATELGLHHSTVQARVVALADELGYDVRSAPGRSRLALALALRRLATNRFT